MDKMSKAPMAEIEKISAEELAAAQALYTEWQAAAARLEGALRVMASIHKLPNGSNIDPQTGVITRPEPTTEAS